MQQKLPNIKPVKLVGPTMFLMYMQSLVDIEVCPDPTAYTYDFENYDFVVSVSFKDNIENREVYPQKRLPSDKIINVAYPYSSNVLLALQDLVKFLHGLYSVEGDVNSYGWY